MKLTRMRAENLEKFIADWREAAAAGLSRSEFSRLTGISNGGLYCRQKNLERRGISLPLLKGQRGVGYNRKHRVMRVRMKRASATANERVTTPLRFVLYVGDCVA